MSAILEADRISVLRGSNHDRRTVLNEISFSLATGEWVDIMGVSGAGKSTFLEAMACLIPLESGELRYRSQPARSISVTQWRTKVTLVPQKPAALPGTVKENLLAAFRLQVHAEKTVPEEDVLIAELYNMGLADLPLERICRELSVGQLARVALLRALLPQPTVLLLDEVTANLDGRSADELLRRLIRFNKQGGSVLRVRHHHADGIAHRTLIFSDGRLREE